MTYLGILLVFLLGLSVIQFVNKKFSLLELLGFSFPIGIGIVTLLMFLLNILGIIFTATNLMVSIAIIIVFANYRFLLKPSEIGRQIKSTNRKEFFYLGKFNLLWLGFVLVIFFVLTVITLKNLYWPTLASDSVSSFDLYAKAIAREGKLLNSLIIDRGVGYGAAYPPLFSLSLAYSYIIGFESSKIISALLFISFIIAFYAILLRNGSSLAAIIITFFMMVSPELLGQSAINTTSVPQAMYGSLGIILLFTWYQTKQMKYFYLSVILLALNGWIRSEGILYIGAGILFLAYVFFKNRLYLKQFIFIFFSLSLFVIWQLFLFVNSELMNPFIEVNINIKPNTDYDTVKTILYYTKINFLQTGFYGITFYVFAITFFFNLVGFIKKKDNFHILILILIVLVGYLYLLNQVDSHGASLEAFMKASAKRFFFGIVILMWFYFAQISYIKDFFTYLERFIAIPINNKLND